MSTATILFNGQPLDLNNPPESIRADVFLSPWEQEAGYGAHGCYCRRCYLHDDPAGCLVRFPAEAAL